MIGRRKRRLYAGILAVGMVGAGMALGQAQAVQEPAGGTSQPKLVGDARSESEVLALGYMRVVLRAEHAYKKKHGQYTNSLSALAGTGSFTKRMAQSTDRGDYTASFRSRKDGFILTMTPKHMDAEHRSFYAEEDGVIHGDDQKPADLESPRVQ
ncbi:MAG: hypothetical protein ABSG70_19840 [Terriglobales bacterium]